MRDTLHRYLEERPSGVSAAELLALVFPAGSADTDFGRDFLRLLLAEDPRVQETSPGLWCALDDHLFARPIQAGPFVVVDLETTGQRAGEEGVTEIGAVRIEHGREAGRFESLVNPGRPIPPFVASLTGINDEMVADAPRFDSLLEGFVEFCSDAVLVAHNAAFDVALLDHECRRILGRPLGLPSLCTVKLAQRLMPELRKTSLDALATHFGLEVDARHRAMGDAETTARFLEHFIGLLGEQGQATVGDLLAAQVDPESRRRLEIGVPQPVIEGLPEGPGVYRLLGERNRTLLVARAANVRDKVVRQFLSTAHASDRQIGMISATRDIACRPCGGDLEAALVEATEIRRFEPEYNRGGKHMPKSYFFRLATGANFPRAMVATRVKPDGSLYIGPIRGRSLADDTVELLAGCFGLRTCAGGLSPAPDFEACRLAVDGWCTSPCNGAVDAEQYRGQVEAFEEFARAGVDGLEQRAGALRAARGTHKQPVRRLQAAARRLERAARKGHWLVNAASYLAVEAHVDGGLFVAPVLEGRPLETAWLRRPEDIDALLQSVVAQSRPQGRGRRGDADAATILVHWHQEALRSAPEHVVTIDPSDPAVQETAAAALVELLAAENDRRL